MTHVYPDGSRWSWLHFACAFAVGGCGTLFEVDPEGVDTLLLMALGGGLVCGVIAGRFGNAAWGWISGVFD